MTTAKVDTKSELEMLKEQATQLGLEYAVNVTARSLKKQIAEHLAKDTEEDLNQARKDVEDEALKLVRVIITPTDPTKRDWKGEYFITGNAVIGTIKRYVPYGVEWLIENALLKSIKEREYHFISSQEKTHGVNALSSRFLPAYTIVELPLPTKEEIEQLAKSQDVAKAVI